MNRLLQNVMKGVVVGLVSAIAAPALRAQIPIEERTKALEDFVKKKNDEQAATVIDGIGKSFASFNDEEKKKAVQAVEKCLNANRPENEDKLYEAVVASFMNMGELGEKATLRALNSTSVSKRRGVLAATLRSLAVHKNPANVKTIADMLKNSEPIVVAGAADALALYADQPEKVRRPVVEELVKAYATYGSAASNAQADNKQKNRAKDNLAVVEGPLRDALKKLTAQDFKDYAAAQKWYNDNKGKKWDEPSKN